jgi:hypothetical protein
MARTFAALVLVCAAVVFAGCGGSDSGKTSGADPNDKRSATLACLKQDKGLPARPLGPNSIQVDDPRSGPRITFFLNGGEAEAKQFEGGAEGSEQIGAALLFVRRGSNALLGKVEDCLDSI